MLLRDVLGSIENLKSEKTKINEVMRETGVNPLRSMLSPAPGNSGDYQIIAPYSTSAVALSATKNITSDDQQQTNAAAAASSSSSQPSSKAVQKKHRLQ